ncbi:MAG: formate dehydrogenase accessory sulfurtransferase FdhD [Thermodesulfovibrionales bacterium]|nr:formate dehydrogenase accessory sulfurtransferase FdhD [Thermodesulfovibrionales bacterium]
MSGIIKRKVKKAKIKENTLHIEEVDDPIAVERALRIRVNGKDVLRLYCTPLMVRELVVGLLLGEDIIRGSWCAERMEILYGDEITVNVIAEEEPVLEGVTITSGCVGGLTFEKKELRHVGSQSLRLEPFRLKELFNEFQLRSILYRSTGCIHSAALSDGKILLAFAEDIGRHNAIDKIIGYSILERIELEGKIIFASGRLSSEMITKCARWSVPVVVSRTAPTTRALDIAERTGMTVVGFMRADRFNVYTHPERIL